MDVDSRYELLEKIGSGSFATVYRARDTELGREVAVKQIHEQYLDDPEQLERYWEEAQLLASLQHPNVVTIFDIHRERGWLILELMQSNLAVRTTGRQMDLRAVRTTVAHCLRAMKYLHTRGIVHGDIKPGNMMIDARRRVKIGDFGLARRVSDDDGSLLKGTTKYMAPESVSDEFGEVGPQSDLYSLGFAAYELMCGPNFESLFPGLSSFGRNKQVAWMMWHAAPDRRLPDINRVLQGVPEDLSTVIQRLCEKDPTKRYQSAEDALSDLNIDLKVINRGGSDEDADDGKPPEDPQRKKRLLLAGTALLASMIVGAVIYMMPGKDKPKQSVRIFEVVSIDTAKREIRVLDLEDDRRAKKFKIPKSARIYLEHFGKSESKLLEDLAKGDRLEIEFLPDGEKSVMKVTAARPYVSRGRIVKLDTQQNSLVVALDEVDSHVNLTLRIPKKMYVVKNLDRKRLEETTEKRARSQLINRYSMNVNSVHKDDFVEFAHLPELGKKRGRVISGMLFVSRLTSASGRVTEFNAQDKYLAVSYGSDNRVNLPLAEDCKISVEEDGTRKSEQSSDVIRKGDVVDIKYDTAIREIHITRGAEEIRGALSAVRPTSLQVVVSVSGGGKQETIFTNAGTRIRIGSESATIGDLRVSDQVVVLATAIADGKRTATAITANRLARSGRRAVLIGVRAFDDKSLQEISYAKANVDLLAKTLETRYAMQKPDRLKILDDPTRRTMETQIAKTLGQSGEGTEVVIYIASHAFVVEGKVYIAGRKVDPKNIATTGMRLDWLIEQLEQCKATSKILLFDCSHAWRNVKRPDQPSTAKMIELSGHTPKTSVVITSSAPMQQTRFSKDQIHGAFAKALAESYAGAADADRDLTITGDELFVDLSTRMKAADPDKSQTPVRFPAK